MNPVSSSSLDSDSCLDRRRFSSSLLAGGSQTPSSLPRSCWSASMGARMAAHATELALKTNVPPGDGGEITWSNTSEQQATISRFTLLPLRP